MTRYLIDGITLFDDELYELSVPDDPASAVVLLGAAASRCLSALLEAQGTIVTKKELLYQGWERYGQQVSGNSVNQSVAQIRRCLASLGQSPDSLVTVPRIGYKLADCLAIRKLGDERVESERPASEARPCAASGLPTASGVLLAEPGNPLVSLTEAIMASARREPHRIRRLWPQARLAGYLCAFLGLNTVMALSWGLLRGTSPLATQIHVPYASAGNNDQHLYFAGAVLNGRPDAVQEHIAQLRRMPPSATAMAERRYVYINGTLRDQVYSYFLCHEPIDHAQARCLSYLIVDESSP